jgi:hypothetical protein
MFGEKKFRDFNMQPGSTYEPVGCEGMAGR